MSDEMFGKGFQCTPQCDQVHVGVGVTTVHEGVGVTRCTWELDGACMCF